ncbi:efflux RND transporter periplasmic adaptor subunit [Myroides sp. LJL115]
MSKIKNILKNNTVKYSVLLLAGLLLGYMIFGSTSHSHELSQETQQESVVWTCSMHPQIKMDKPGKCPLCAMDLTPMATNGDSDQDLDPNAIVMSKSAVALANIQTTVVSSKDPVKDIELYGSIQVDETQQNSQSSHVAGRIEKLYVNFTGEKVNKGQLLASVYSPELYAAQQELLEAIKLQDFQPLLLQAAKEKLSFYKMSNAQIQNIIDTKKASAIVNIYANTQGTVVSKNVQQGDYISSGTILYDIANLSKVWAVFDAYEQDLPFLKVKDKVSFTLQSFPGEKMQGTISFINPLLDPSSRTAKVRVEVENKDLNLLPAMYATVTIQAALSQYNNQIVIPKSAVLWTGKRSIVYTKVQGTSSPTFMLQEVVLGPNLGQSYVILEGLMDGQEIVTNGVFIIDASAQLEGKPSMMNLEDPIDPKLLEKSLTQTLHVSGNCEMCQKRIQDAALQLPGVLKADWIADNQELTVIFIPEQTSLKQISKAIATVGHDTALDKATDSIYQDLPGCCLYERNTTDKKPSQTKQNHHLTTLVVEGNCGMCKKRIEAAAMSVAGVNQATWNVDNKTLSLDIDKAKASLEKVSLSIAKAGHDTALNKAQDKTYDSLPGCCQYQRIQDTPKAKSNLTLEVKGNCGMCKKRIEAAASALTGVNSAIWNVDTKLLDLDIDPSKTDLAKVSKTIALAGHDTAFDKASEQTYENLHGCCQYQRD